MQPRGLPAVWKHANTKTGEWPVPSPLISYGEASAWLHRAFWDRVAWSSQQAHDAWKVGNWKLVSLYADVQRSSQREPIRFKLENILQCFPSFHPFPDEQRGTWAVRACLLETHLLQWYQDSGRKVSCCQRDDAVKGSEELLLNDWVLIGWTQGWIIHCQVLLINLSA